jgi:hypothetical protein
MNIGADIPTSAAMRFRAAVGRIENGKQPGGFGRSENQRDLPRVLTVAE